MTYRLLVDMEVIEALQRMKATERRRLLAQFRRIQDFPGKFADFVQPADRGMGVSVCVFGRWAIHFWPDFNDRHVKVLKLLPADR